MVIKEPKETPLVSCIVTSYKKVPFLFGAIDSVLSQDYPRIELLIADDGSPDFECEVFEEYISKNKGDNIENVVVCHHAQNMGLVRNLNSMLRIATGDYFMTLSGDDVFYSQHVIQQVVDRFISTNEDFLACSRMLCSESMEEICVIPSEDDLKQIRKLNTKEKQLSSFLVFQFHNIASGSAMYYSRKNLEEMGIFDEEYDIWEDGPRLVKYVKTIGCIPTAHDIVAIKYRGGGINNLHIVTPATYRLMKDHEHFMEAELIPNQKKARFFRKRKLLFWYRWDRADDHRERLKLLLTYPERTVGIVFKKILGKPIR